MSRNTSYQEKMKKQFETEEISDIYGKDALGKLLFGRDDREKAEEAVQKAAKWFLLPHPNGRDHQGEPDFVACSLIRFLYMFDGKMQKETRDCIRSFFTKWNFESKYKSENHMLLFRSSRYLFALKYPDIYFEQYQKTAEKIRKEDEKFLIHFIVFRAQRGWAEFDSYGYGAECCNALFNLVDFAEAGMQAYAAKSLDVMMLDMIEDCSKNGLYGGAHGRVYERMVMDFRDAPMCGIYQFFFGSEVHPYKSIHLLTTSYKPSDYVYQAVENRPDVWECYECKHLHSITEPTPHMQVEQVPGNINKYTYITPDYIMGSVNWQDDYPKDSPAAWYAHHQQHEWELTLCFAGDLRIFTQHPGHYGQEGKEHGYWIGDLGCCCGHFYSKKNVLLALYDIPEREEGWIHAYVPLKKLHTKLEGNRLWFSDLEERVYGLLWTSSPMMEGTDEWKDVELVCKGYRHAVACYVEEASKFASMQAFQDSVNPNLPEFDETEFSLTFHGLKISKTERSYQGQPEAFPYPTYDSPIMKSEWGSGVVRTGETTITFSEKTDREENY